MITEMVVYITSDGQSFYSKQLAEQHEKTEELKLFYSDNINLGDCWADFLAVTNENPLFFIRCADVSMNDKEREEALKILSKGQ